MTSIVIIIVVVVSITVECMLSLILTNYIIIDAMIIAFKTLLVIGCNRESKMTHVKCEKYCRMLHIHITISSNSNF